MPNNVLPLSIKQTFPPFIWIFTEGEGIESRLPFKIFSTFYVPPRISKPSYGPDFHNGQLDEAERLSVHGMVEKWTSLSSSESK